MVAYKANEGDAAYETEEQTNKIKIITRNIGNSI